MNTLFRISFFLIISTSAYSQFRFPQRTYFSIGGGSSAYFGDLSPYRSPLRGIAKTLDRNIQIEFGQDIVERWSHSYRLSFIQLRGDDFSYGKNQQNLVRNLHFKNNIIEASFLQNLMLSPYYDLYNRERPNFIPYLSIGVGLIYHSPKAKTPVNNGNDINQEWVSLSKLGVAGKKYFPIMPVLPLAIGFRKKLSHNIDFKFDLNFRITSTDYLDDVSDEPYLSRNSFNSDLAYQLHNRSNEETEALNLNSRTEILTENKSSIPVKGSRGTKGVVSFMDSYLTSSFSFQFWLDRRIR
ncbi:hypothetical protein [Lacihabitans lacunae]|uniref:DUF6089 domain-containing protein n=1 Tax=Lacihabitans lacunae TaxID=1028214 RepID=A0ABV7YRF8_9BACT